MLRHRRVAMVAGLVGALFALVLPFAITSPAWALNDNVVTVTKVVNGTPAQLGNFEVVVTCDDGPQGQPAQTQTLTFAPTGGTQSATFDPAFISCTVVETQTRGADATAIQAVSPTASITVPNANNATVPISILFKAGPQPPGAAQTVNVGITNTFIPRNPNVVNVTKNVVGDAPAGSFFQIDVNCGGATVSLLFTAAGGTKPASFPSSDVGNCNVLELIASPGLGTAPALQQISYSVTGVSPPLLTCNPLTACGPANFGPFTTGVGGGGSKAVTVTNRYPSPNPPNTITVTKRVRGRTPANVTGFTVVVTCAQTPGDPVVVPAGQLPPPPANTVTQSHTFPTTGGTFDFQSSKEFRDCNVRETPLPAGLIAPPDYQGTITPANGILNPNAGPNDVNFRFAAGGNKSAAVTITNRYSGDNVLTVTKQTLGQVPPGSLFLVRVDCSNNLDGNTPENNTFPGPNAIPLNNPNPNPNPNPPQAQGSVWLLFGEGQPVSQQIYDADQGPPSDDDYCTVVETVSGGATQVVYGATADSPDTLLIVSQPPPGLGGASVYWPRGPVNPVGDDAQVVITNRFNPCPTGQPKCTDPNHPLPTNEITVKKRIRGDAPNPPSFTLRLRCSGGGVVEERLLTFTSQVPQTVEVPATRSNCVLTETVNGGAASVEYFAKSRTGADATYGANSARVDFSNSAGVDGGGHARLQVTNRFPGTCPPSSPKYC